MKISFLSLPLTGHLNPILVLARRMQTRGHEVVFHGICDMERAVVSSGLPFVAIGQQAQPAGWLSGRLNPLSSMHGMDAMQAFVETISVLLLESALAELPARYKEEGIDAVVVDSAFLFAQLAPISIGLPYAQVWAVMHRHPEDLMPLPWFSDGYEDSAEARDRYLQRAKQIAAYGAAVAGPVMTFLQRTGLQIDLRQPDATRSRLATVSQVPQAFDFPVADWPSTFHRTAPFVDEEMRTEVEFPWEKLTGEPLIYASLGTLLGNQPALLAAIVQGAASLPGTQLVLATGPFFRPEAVQDLPSNAVVVREAPQLKLLQKAALCVSHAGVNTVLEAIKSGVPLVVIPIAYDQFGVAARVTFHGLGLFTELEEATPVRVGSLMRKTLEDSSYRIRTQAMARELASLDGPGIAADVLERAFKGHFTERKELSVA